MSAPLKIAIDARLPAGFAGGVEQVLLGLASGFAALEDGDEEYYFLATESFAALLAPFLGGRVRTLVVADPQSRATMKERLGAALPLVRYGWQVARRIAGRRAVPIPSSDGTIERAGIDVMHFATQLGFVTEVPSIYHPHDLQHLHLPQFFQPFDRLSREVRYRTFCNLAEVVCVASSWTKEDLIRHYALPPEKIAVVPLAPVLNAYPTPSESDLAAVRAKHSLPEAFIFTPAQTWPHKNHLRLFEALAILKERGLVIPFVSSGRKTPFVEKILRRAKQLGILDQVQFLGFVTPMELSSLYALCRAVVIPTKFEAGSFPLWEAFLAGAPAACSNVTSLPTQAGDAALIFDPDDPRAIADAVERLWTDASLRERLVDAGRKNVARFTWDRTVRSFRALYRRVGKRELSEEDRGLLEGRPLL